MKKILIVISALILSGCASPEPVATKGEVISCVQVNSDKSIIEGIKVECLGDSDSIAIESLRGPMVINVWGSWCTTCLAEMPELAAFYAKAKGKVGLVGVAVEEVSPDDSRRFIEDNGMSWPNYYDRENKTRAYFGMGVPVTWFIDAAGVVKHKKYGEIKSDQEIIDLTAQHLGIQL